MPKEGVVLASALRYTVVRMTPAPLKVSAKILIIDDDPFLSGMYASRLVADGFTVTSAMDGVEGLEVAKRDKPDVILLDILMPRMDGFETLKRLKADKNLKNIQVLMLTSLGQKDDIDRALQQGAADYLMKTQTLPSDASEKIKKLLMKK